MFHRKLLLTFFCISTSLLAMSSDFLYNHRELTKSQVLLYSNFALFPSNLFSYDLAMKAGINYYYLNRLSQAEEYFFRASELARNNSDKSNAYYWLGRSFLKHREPVKASQYFAQVLNQNPNPAGDFLFFYGMSLYETGNYDGAINCFLNYESQTKTQLQPKELPLFIGATALANGNYDLAKSYLEQTQLKSDPISTTQSCYLSGLNCYINGEKDKSLEMLNKVKTDTNLPFLINRARLIVGTIYFEKNELSKAINEFESIIQDTISNYKEQAYLRTGISYQKQNKLTKALTYYDTLLQKYPNSELNELAIYYKAQIFKQTDKLLKSAREYRKFLALYPKSPLAEEVNANLGKVLFDEKNYLEAIPVLEDFIKNYPKSKFRNEALYNLIQSCIELNKYEKVKIYGGKYLREFPQSLQASNVHYRLGTISIQEKDTSNAIKHFTRVTNGQFYPYALNELGNIHYGLGSYSQALKYFNLAELVSLDTLVDDIRLNREKIYLKQGQYETEIEMFKNYLSKYPQSYKAAQIQYGIANYYLLENDITTAIREFDKVSNYDATSQYVPMAETAKANCYTKIGEIEQVKNCYLKIINNFPKVPYLPQVLYNLATIYNQSQKLDSAIIFYDRLVSNFPKAGESEVALLELAKTYQKIDNLTNAIIIYERFIVVYTNSNYEKQAYVNLTDAYINMGNFTSAERTIKNAFNKFGKFGDGYFKLGKINFINNKIGIAKNNFLDAHNFYLKEEKQELAAVALWEAGKCAIELKKWNEAQDLFNRCKNETQDERLRIECDNQLKLIPK